MTKRELMRALEGLDDEARVWVEVEYETPNSHYYTEERDVRIKNVYRDSIVLKAVR